MSQPSIANGQYKWYTFEEEVQNNVKKGNKQKKSFVFLLILEKRAIAFDAHGKKFN